MATMSPALAASPLVRFTPDELAYRGDGIPRDASGKHPLAETGELLRIMQIMQREAIGSEHDHEGDTEAKRRRLRCLREKIARLREHNEHPVGNSHEAAYLANARIKTDDMALAMIDDALKGL